MEEQIVVTGSRVRRKDLTTPAPVTVLSRQQWQESGKLTIGEFLQSLPEQGNAPNFQLNNGGATYGADGSTRINLRSLGVTRTLVLVNGRRMVNAGLGASSSVDLNSIPTAAVDRIEVLKDGASAIYGSDAIAGVVNVITRRNYNGTELAAQYGVSYKGDAKTFDGQVTTGRSSELGNFIFSAGYFNQGDSWLRDRGWSQYALTYDYLGTPVRPGAGDNNGLGSADPGGSSRTPQGTIRFKRLPNGNPLPTCTSSTLCGQLLAAYPAGVTFIRDASAPLGWRPFISSGSPNDTYNFAAENYLTIPSERVQLYSSGDAHIGIARPYYEASYVQRHSQQNAAPMPLNPGDYTYPGTKTAIFVSQYNMYNPFGTDMSFTGRRLVEFGHRTYTQDLDTFRVVTGVDGTLPDTLGPARGWFWDASLNYGRTSGAFVTNGAIRNSRIADSVGPSMLVNGVPTCVRTPNDPSTAIAGCVPINLFGGPNNGSITAEQINSLGFEGTSRALDILLAVDANVTGDLFPLFGARPMSLALGYEFRRQSGEQIADPIAASGDSADFNFTSTSGWYHANEAYAELSIPILANAPLVQELEASAAGRWVDYSTFGSKFTYKFGARYTPIPDVTIRGTFSTAFRAPSISELYLGQSETAPTVRDPCGDLASARVPQALKDQCTGAGVPATGSGDVGNQELARVGGTPTLKAETAKIFTAGVVLQPQMLRNFSVTVDYYHTTVDDPVGTIGLATILHGCYPGGGATPFQPYCDRIARSTDGAILYVNDFNTNLRQIRTAGIDLAVRYALPTPVGRFGASFDGNWLAFFDRDQEHAPTIHGKGTYDLGALPEYKFNVGASWSLAGFTAGAIGRYIGTFKECSAFDYDAGSYLSVGGLCWLDPNAPARQVRHNFVVDLNAAYTLSSPAGRTTLALGVNNVFNEAPQFVYAAPLANSDPTAYDYVGRFVYGRVQHTF